MTWKNSARFKAKLAQLPSVIEAATRQAMEEFAEQIVAQMKSIVPVKTGKLRDSIGWTWGKPPRGAKLVFVSKKSSGNENRITIFAGDDVAFYARWVEFGTHARAPGKYRDERKRKRNSGKYGHPATPAQPFFFPVWRANKRRLGRTINPKVYAAIKKLAGEQNG